MENKITSKDLRFYFLSTIKSIIDNEIGYLEDSRKEDIALLVIIKAANKQFDDKDTARDYMISYLKKRLRKIRSTRGGEMLFRKLLVGNFFTYWKCRVFLFRKMEKFMRTKD